MTTRILITGAKGRLGGLLAKLLSSQYAVLGVDIDELDFTDAKHTYRFITNYQPALVLHCGAMTNVDACAQNPEEALRVNGFGTKNIALACGQVGAALLYVSTNEVFDGHHTGEIHEYAPTAPANPYGYSKWVGEQVIRDHLTQFYIVRTSWLFAHGGVNFVHKIIERAQSGQPMRVVSNEVAAPTYNDDLAAAIVKLIKTQQYGIYHLVNAGRASRWAFARRILDLLGMASLPIEKIVAAEFHRPSTPPEYSVLQNTAAAHLGIKLRPWEEALQAFMQREGLLP